MDQLHFRKAKKEDVPIIVEMLANDILGKSRENFRMPLPEKYLNAFDKIQNDPNQELIVAESRDGAVVGTLQLTFIQYLTHQGSVRVQVEAVRIRDSETGKGYGEQLLRWAITRAREKDAHLIQLTSDKQRPDAIRFYEKLGFKASHEGMKLRLT
jgi:GNAT superfamily N-acetyltransferase